MSRFDELEARLAAHGAADPGGLARYIGMKKYGRAGFKALQKAGQAAGGSGDGRSNVELLGVRLFVGRSYLLQDCHVRANGDGRTVEAYAAAFNTPAEINDQDGHYNEVVAPGSFDKTIAENGTRFGVFYNHARTIYGTDSGQLSVPIGVPVEAPRADGHGVLTVTRYLDNPLADSVLDAIKQKAITAQSFSGRFIKSQKMRAVTRSSLPTITRQEVAMREYGPTPFPAYMQASIVGTRSAAAWMTDLLAMDPDDRADLFAQMQAIAAPLTPTRVEPVREAITVTTSRTTEPPATPVEEPAPAPTTAEPAAGPADEPHTHSTRHADTARRARVARIMREELV